MFPVERDWGKESSKRELTEAIRSLLKRSKPVEIVEEHDGMTITAAVLPDEPDDAACEESCGVVEAIEPDAIETEETLDEMLGISNDESTESGT